MKKLDGAAAAVVVVTPPILMFVCLIFVYLLNSVRIGELGSFGVTEIVGVTEIDGVALQIDRWGVYCLVLDIYSFSNGSC